uniref:hypothetical protein n=1 Tax=Haloprofundus sp. MHR1 TaxID=2572921 RepID=UPI001F3209A5|nr:hypothetical protein [Haloprofundus sp. MHR1]
MSGILKSRFRPRVLAIGVFILVMALLFHMHTVVLVGFGICAVSVLIGSSRRFSEAEKNRFVGFGGIFFCVSFVAHSIGFYDITWLPLVVFGGSLIPMGWLLFRGSTIPYYLHALGGVLFFVFSLYFLVKFNIILVVLGLLGLFIQIGQTTIAYQKRHSTSTS